MVDLSTRSLSLFGVLLITALAAGCAQSGDGPTSPSAMSLASSGAASAPGASYDATGTWHFVTTDAEGNVIEDIETAVSQDGHGNISFMNDADELITLERIGSGVVILYRLAAVSDEGGDCDVRIHATVRLDTRTNTLTGALRLNERGCSNEKAKWTVTGTKVS